ncbi:MAG: TonB-dependent siderophore receptor [Idiomarina sp.]|uniref:Fe(3+) dicitrate transport protein n=2 Tax=Aliidiomarina maris TaxID=531312 RepID=A0A327X2H2_9GAMM|nr:TonB-dependent siderophore receptor [Idiomarina sp.]RAK00586.1 Fe(3+) dicitrate transport protein [Aliidiomarina maris]RUO27401.1 TonB-dependent siderophore receptor [Aliidiomarina maris]
MQTRMSKLSFSILLATLPLAAHAQDQASDPQPDANHPLMPSIEVISVKGQTAAHRFDETGSVVLVTEQDIARIQPLSTEDMLRRIPGINVKSEEETSVVANFGLRGLSASESKSLILEDGVPVAPGLFIGNDRYYNPRVQRMAGIEILKGSSSLRYGPSTIGGVVNYQTKTPDDGVALAARVGSFDMREVTVEAGNRTQSGDAFGGVIFTHAQSDGFMDKGYEMNDVMFKTGARISDNQRIGMKFSYHENDANISYRGLFLDAYLAGERYNPAPDDYYLQDRVAFDANHELIISPSMTLKTLVYWSDVSRDYWRYDVDTAASEAAGRWVYTDNLVGNNRSFERFGVESRLLFDNDLFGLVASSEIGFRYMTEESDDRRIRATREQDRTGLNDRHRIDSADSYAVHAQTRVGLTDRLSVTPGIRVESYQQSQVVLTDSNATAKTSNTEYLPGVGFTFDANPATQFYGGVYRAFSPATNGVALDGLMDQNLDGERSNNFELGVRGSLDRLRYEVAAFYMDFGNQVVTGNTDPNLSQSNGGETEHYGMEFLLGYDLGRGFDIDANATWVPKSEFQSGEFAGNRLPYAPKLTANLALNYNFENLTTSFIAHHRGEQFGDPSNQVDIPAGAGGGIWGGLLPSYTVYDITTQYAVTSQMTVFGSIKNLTDKDYIAGLRQGIYVGPERSFEVGVRYRF